MLLPGATTVAAILMQHPTGQFWCPEMELNLLLHFSLRLNTRVCFRIIGQKPNPTLEAPQIHNFHLSYPAFYLPRPKIWAQSPHTPNLMLWPRRSTTLPNTASAINFFFPWFVVSFKLLWEFSPPLVFLRSSCSAASGFRHCGTMN